MKKMGLLVDLDFCMGCWACQSACNEKNKLPLGQTYLRMLNNKVEEVDGELMVRKFPVPLELDHCAECVPDGKQPVCARICIGKALTFGDPEALLQKAEVLGRRTILYS